MIFKNKRGEVHWYVIGIIIALVVLLLVLFGPVKGIFDSQKNTGEITKDTCRSIAEGQCKYGVQTCTTGQRSVAGYCPRNNDGQSGICCVTPKS